MEEGTRGPGWKLGTGRKNKMDPTLERRAITMQNRPASSVDLKDAAFSGP